MTKRISIINKYGIEGNAMTGKAADELANILLKNGFDVCVVSTDASYNGEKNNDDINILYRTKKIRNLYSGQQKIIRLLFHILDGFRLIVASLWHKDYIKIVMTDPSLLNMWAVILRPFYRSKLVFWTMDLYPDAFSSAGLVKRSNLLYKIINNIVYSNPPDFLIALGEKQKQYLESKYNKSINGVVLPCGINTCNHNEIEPEWKKENRDKIIFCYAGNIGEAHDANFLIEFIDSINPIKHLLLLKVYGAKSKLIINHAKNKVGVLILDHIELQYIDVNIASLSSLWNHVCVPSKAVSAICSHTPLLYNASKDSEAYNMFADAIWLIPYSEQYKVSINQFLNTLTCDCINYKKECAIAYLNRLQDLQKQSIEHIIAYCKGN